MEKKWVIILTTKDQTKEKFWPIYRTVKPKVTSMTALRGADERLHLDVKPMKNIVYDCFSERLHGQATPVGKIKLYPLEDKYSNKVLRYVSSTELRNVLSSFRNNKAMALTS